MLRADGCADGRWRMCGCADVQMMGCEDAGLWI